MNEQLDGSAVLDQVEGFLSRFVIYPGEAEKVAHVLWIAHAWFMHAWDSTPRIAFLSPEPGSGKSRALEVTDPLVPRPVHAVNATPAYLFRKVSDPEGSPTILFDEIDTVFGPKAKENEELRGLLNAGHRKGAMAGRCVIRGKEVLTEELPAYSAVALAGLDDLPDTIRSRSILVRMRRRAPGETVEPWRLRTCGQAAKEIHNQLATWATQNADKVGTSWPVMPEGVEDRDADVWEALLAVADLAGGDWPNRARAAAVELVTKQKQRPPSIGIMLLSDIREAFTSAGKDRISTEELLAALNRMDESPWGNIRGAELDARGLSRRLSKYGIKPRPQRNGSEVFKGYAVGDFADSWARYLPAPASGDKTVTTVTSVTPQFTVPQSVTDQVNVTDSRAETTPGCNRVTEVTDKSHGTREEPVPAVDPSRFHPSRDLMVSSIAISAGKTPPITVGTSNTAVTATSP